MKIILKKFVQFAHKLARLKHNKKAVLWIMAIDAALAVSSIVVDWPWLMRVTWYLRPFAPICSLYPLLLFIWFTVYYFRKKVPVWYTAFLFMGIVSYGLMAWIYFPGYMGWNGINFHDVGSIAWVTAYAGQAFIIGSELRKMPFYQYVWIFGYFFFKDYADRYLGTFLDVLLDSYPESLKLFFSMTIVTLHVFAASLLLYFSFKPKPLAAEKLAYEPTTE